MDNRYIVIGRSSCPFCTLALELLEERVIECVFLDYENSREVLEDYKQFYDQKTVPIILCNDLKTGHTKKVGGYSDLLEYIK